MAHDVFISHSVKDKAVADALCAWLERDGVRCWMAPRDILPGLEWGEAIIKGINSTRIFVLIFSSNANTSKQIIREVERAVNRGMVLVPFRVEDVPPSEALEYYISTPHWLDALTPPLEAHLERLSQTVATLLGRPAPEAAPAPPVPAPRPAEPRATQPRRPGPAVASIALLPLPDGLEQGDVFTAAARLRTADGVLIPGGAVRWESSAPDVARVDAAGQVTCLAPGWARLSASAGAARAEAELQVHAPRVTEVSLIVPSTGLRPGDRMQLEAVLRDRRGLPVLGSVRWDSSAPAVAAVSPAGLLSALAPGTAVVSVRCGDAAARATLTVGAAIPAEVRISAFPGTVTAGGRFTLTAAVSDARGEPVAGARVAWSSSDRRVAAVGDGGEVEARTPGEAVITAACGGRTASVRVRVVPVPLASVGFADPPARLREGRRQRLRAYAVDVRGGRAHPPFAWESSDPAVLAVAADGMATAGTPGRAVVTARAEGVAGRVEVEVTAAGRAPAAAYAEALRGLAARVPRWGWAVPPASAAVIALWIAWPSSGESGAAAFAEVAPPVEDSAAAGAAEAPAEQGAKGDGDGARRGVVSLEVAVAGVLRVGETVRARATARGADGERVEGRPVWSSNDTDVLRVSASTGSVDAVGVGTATLTARVGTASRSVRVRVERADVERSDVEELAAAAPAPATGGTASPPASARVDPRPAAAETPPAASPPPAAPIDILRDVVDETAGMEVVRSALQACAAAVRARNASGLEAVYRPASAVDRRNLNLLTGLMRAGERGLRVVGETGLTEPTVETDEASAGFSVRLQWRNSFGASSSTWVRFRVASSHDGERWGPASCRIIGTPDLG